VRYISTILIFFIGCQLTLNRHYVNPDYISNRRFNATLLVMPLSPDFVKKSTRDSLLAQKNSTPTSLDQRERNYFNHYMGPVISELTTADVIGIDPFFSANELTYSYKQLTFDEELTIQLLAPDTGVIKYRNITPDFVLFIEDLHFEKEFVEERNGLGRWTSNKYTMDTGVKYLFWDNQSQRIAAYGKLEERMDLLNYPDKAIYLKVFESFASEMIHNSPLVHKQVSL